MRLVSFPLALLWFGCTEADKTPPGDTKDSPPRDDSGTTEVAPPEVLAWLSVSPATLPLDTGGTVKLVARVSRALEVYQSGGHVFAWTLENGESVPGSATVVAEDQLAFSFTLPPQLAAGPARVRGTLTMDGVAFSEVRVGASGGLDDSLTRMSGEGWSAFSIVPDGGAVEAPEICGAWSVDGGAGVRYDLVMMVSECRVVVRACPSSGEACAEIVEDPCLGAEADMFCGKTDHFKPAGGSTITLTGVTHDVDGRTKPSRFKLNFDAATGTFSDSKVATLDGLAPSAAVLGLETSGRDNDEPLVGVLAVAGDSRERWGTWHDGTQPWFWTGLGTVTPDAVADGLAWVGLFSDADLSGEEPGDTFWAWSVDPAAYEGQVLITVSQPVAGSGSFTRVRDVVVPDPGFTIEAVAAGGEDLDGDGLPELFVQAWGEGTGVTWLVLSATDKADTSPVRTLSGPPAQLYPAALHPRLPVRTWHHVALTHKRLVGGGGRIRDIQHHPDKWDYQVSSPPGAVLVSIAEWDTARLLEPAATEVEPEPTGMVGTMSLQLRTGTEGKGMCRYGQCWVYSGFGGMSLRVLGDGNGAASFEDAPIAGDLIWMGPSEDGQHAIVTRAMMSELDVAATQPRAVADDADGNAEVAAFSVVIGGGSVIFSDNSTLTVGGGSTLSVNSPKPAGNNSLILISTPAPQREDVSYDTVLASGGTTQGWSTFARPLPAPSRGSSAPELVGRGLLARSDGTTGALITWRDGDGQAWLGLIDVDAATSSREGEMPFIEGPTPVGDAVFDTEGWLGLGTGRPGVVARDIIADTPFLSMEDLESRFSAWDTGVGDGAAWGGDPEPGALPGLFLVVGAAGGAGCGFQTWYLPPRLSLEAAIADAEVVDQSDDPTCADLGVPVLSFSPVPDAPQLAVLLDRDGELSLQLADRDRVLGGVVIDHVSGPIYTSPSGDTDGWAGRAVSAGDLDGDGLSDLVIRDAEGLSVWTSDGLGGFGAVDVSAMPFTNFAVLLSGSSARESDCDPDGGEPPYVTGTWQ